ncbi:MAG: HAD family hydrolase [Bacteroidetes bacterium]|nr:HAD family hydrolase [Bacteroidota bacterium]MBK7970139.1 HAD family hydrolase [Bacteroidota bacterium]MBK8414261.1 HAD family hydrolase [Bacteroidota bacterium]MBK9048293.1 HAD family hydrolase [Bacteroidota bacterium]MBK9425400.1 HAD family hydrolase [Bacteroidota bacterium]
MFSDRKVLFLDRDGVINRDAGDYTYQWEKFEFLPGLFPALLELQTKGFSFIIITNQAGISKGIYSHRDVDALHTKMIETFKSNGILILEIYYCPHHDSIEKCLCRKPGSLLVEKALARFQLDPSRCYFIGDRERDILAGNGAAVKGILVPENSDLRNYIQQIQAS